VMAGNVGSQRRLEYTTIGDTTNTAARLEGMTKGTPHMIFAADSTRAALVGKHPDLIPVADMEVRGRSAPVTVWSLIEARRMDGSAASAVEAGAAPVPEADSAPEADSEPEAAAPA
jgi:class 3 adenylate cyclase